MDHAQISTRTPSGSAGKGSHHVRRGFACMVAAAAVAVGAAFSAAAGTTADFPVSVTDDEGTVVTIPSAPERLISLSPAGTEIVFALGAGERLVGGTDADDFPAEAAAVPDVVNMTRVLMEKVVELEPDLVLAGGGGFTPPADITRMRALDVPVLVLYPPSVDGVLDDIELVGDALGEAEAADALAGRIQDDMDAVSDAVAAMGSRPRTFYEIGYLPDIYGPPAGTVYADLIERAGGDPIFASDLYTISLETLVTEDPEVIVLGDALYGVCPDAVAARPGWGGMTAVVEGAIRPVNDIVVTRPGPRIGAGLASLARAIHPEIDLPGFPPDPPMCGAPAVPASPATGVSSAP
jgi:iron complex transport system substrate-binding protein